MNTAMYALNGFSGTVNCRITDLSGARVRDILVNRTFNSSNPITFGTPPSFTLLETGGMAVDKITKNPKGTNQLIGAWGDFGVGVGLGRLATPTPTKVPNATQTSLQGIGGTTDAGAGYDRLSKTANNNQEKK